jgi:phage FluMu protein Com
MLLQCPTCSKLHSKTEALITAGIKAGAIAYVDALCPWCRLVYDIGTALNSPLGALLCGIAIGTLIVKISEV